MPLIVGSAHDIMSPRDIFVDFAPPRRSYLLPCRYDISMPMDHIFPVVLLYGTSSGSIYDRRVNVLEGYMAEVEAVKGRDLRLEVHRIRYEASRDRPRGRCCVIGVCGSAIRIYTPLVVGVIVTSARTISRAPGVGASLPFNGSPALGV
jgi:hypothetical protein